VIATALALVLSLGDAASETCRRPSRELAPIERSAPRFPIDGPRAGYVRDGDLAVFDVEVDRAGLPRQVALHCSMGSPLLVRVSEAALRRWRFAPAAAPYRGQVAITYDLLPAVANAAAPAPRFLPPPQVGGVERFQACAAQPPPGATLTAEERCQVDLLRTRCSPADDCLVTCLTSTAAPDLGGGCAHVCFNGPRHRETAWTPPPGWSGCATATPSARAAKPELLPASSLQRGVEVDDCPRGDATMVQTEPAHPSAPDHWHRRTLRYPTRAIRARISGKVELRLQVSPAGHVTYATVIAALPAGYFEATALEAAWRQAYVPFPAHRDAACATVSRTIEFRLHEADDAGA
jgi:TonB family protein